MRHARPLFDPQPDILRDVSPALPLRLEYARTNRIAYLLLCTSSRGFTIPKDAKCDSLV